MKNDSDIICHCQQITYKTIVDAIKQGAKTVDAIGDLTEAGIACGYCIEEIEELLEKFQD